MGKKKIHIYGIGEKCICKALLNIQHIRNKYKKKYITTGLLHSFLTYLKSDS